jgi:hypothetical protein
LPVFWVVDVELIRRNPYDRSVLFMHALDFHRELSAMTLG